MSTKNISAKVSIFDTVKVTEAIFNELIHELTTRECDAVIFAKEREISIFDLRAYMDSSEERKSKFEAANEIQADILVNAAMRIADEQVQSKPDLFTGHMPKGDAQRARLQVEIRLKKAAALCPWKYGGKEASKPIEGKEKTVMKLPDGTEIEI
jgi:hypothetical protein